MLKTINFYHKIILKNPLSLISLLFTIFLIYVQHTAITSCILTFVETYCFGFICTNIFLLIISTYAMYKRYELLDIYEKNDLKKQLSIIFSGLLVSLIPLCLVILSIIFFSYNLYSFKIILEGICHFCFIWFTSNIISLAIGTTVGIIIKNKFSLLTSLVIYCLFPIRLYNLSDNIFYNLFNIYDDCTILIRNSSELLFSYSYFLDKAFIIVLSALVISIGHLFSTNKNNLLKHLFSIIFFITILLGNIYLYSMN